MRVVRHGEDGETSWDDLAHLLFVAYREKEARKLGTWRPCASDFRPKNRLQSVLREVPRSCHDLARDTGKSSERVVRIESTTEGPQVIGSDGGGGDGGEDDGGEGGEDDPPRRPALLRALLRTLAWLYQFVPDLVVTMRRFEDVFPDDIHRTLYLPGKSSLLRELCTARDAEWEQGCCTLAWKWFWRRVRFWWLVSQCFVAWFKPVWPET